MVVWMLIKMVKPDSLATIGAPVSVVYHQVGISHGRESRRPAAIRRHHPETESSSVLKNSVFQQAAGLFCRSVCQRKGHQQMRAL